MSKRHEERARKLHARLNAAMKTEGGARKHSVSDVDRLAVTVHESGGIDVAFVYSNGTTSEISFAPDTNIYDMAREAKKHAVGHCSDIREHRETAAVSAAAYYGDGAEAGHVEVVTEEQADAYNTESAALKARIADALLQHRADAPISAVRDGKPSGLISCLGCGLEAHKPDGANMGSVDADLLRAFAEHQADVVARLL